MNSIKLGGVPLHPALVHFPIAAWTLAVITDGLFYFQGDPIYWSVTYWALVVGVVMALFAMTAGFIDFVMCDPEHPAANNIQTHMMLMGGSWCIFLLDLLMRHRDIPAEAQWWLPVVTLVGFLLLVVGGHLGGRLVYTHGVNVDTAN